MDHSSRKIFNIAFPAIVTNITVPLLNLADVAIVGHFGKASYIGAIAVGGLLFNLAYWVFAFLRMGTSGMTSQAFGRRDLKESVRLLVRSVVVGLFISAILLFFHSPLLRLAFLFVHTTPEVQTLTFVYYRILIWGAPAVLGLYSFTGWFTGMQNARFPMVVAVIQNVVNIVASVFMVYGLDLEVEGVAGGTLLAQYTGLLLAIWFYFRHYHKKLYSAQIFAGLWSRKAMTRFFTVNRDIFLRTLCLVAVTLFFTSAGAAQGDVTLAANAVLMQYFLFFSFIMDGFAFAGEALSGKYWGAGNFVGLKEMIWKLFIWGFGVSLFFSLSYFFVGKDILQILTNEASVISDAGHYIGWVYLIPVVSTPAFLWDGIFIGFTATRQMLLSMAAAAAIFFVCYFSFRNRFGNDALWLAFTVYLFFRGFVQTILVRNISGIKQ